MPPATSPAARTQRPTISVASNCLWMPAPGADPRAAIVTRGGPIVALVVFDPDLDLPVSREAVRHVSDPEFARMSDRSGGVWDYTDEQKRAK